MKKIFITGALFLFALTAKAQTFPFYDADGTLKDNRTVNLNRNFLRFLSTNGGGFFQNGSTGRIGVNTTSPVCELDVRGTLLINNPTPPAANVYNFGVNGGAFIRHKLQPVLSIQGDNSNGFWQGMNLAIAGEDYYYCQLAEKGDAVIRTFTDGSFLIAHEGAGSTKFVSRPVATGQSILSMIITKDGDVGIGTETPDAKLAVNGLIHTKEVKVDLVGWPDYVFENEYKLPTIEEVEQYINENGHLPNVPSAKELEENGLELGEMVKIQQEKIEELTLYTIQQKKQNDELKQELDELKAMVTALAKDKK